MIQRTKCPPFDPFFGAPSMLATARGAKRHLGKLHVSGSKGGMLRPSRSHSRTRVSLMRLRRPLKNTYRGLRTPLSTSPATSSAYEQGAGQNAGQNAFSLAKTGYIQVTN